LTVSLTSAPTHASPDAAVTRDLPVTTAPTTPLQTVIHSARPGARANRRAHAADAGRHGAQGPYVITWTVDLPDEAATRHLALILSETLKPGDMITLSGDLGAGKSTLARALLRILANDPELEAPSPTFTLIQEYETPFGEVAHADLYRLSGADDLIELGWEEITRHALTLVEWPDRAGEMLSPDRLDVLLQMDPAGAEGSRVAVLTGHGKWAARLAMTRAIRTVFQKAGWDKARRTFLQGDASSRSYERLIRPNGQTAVLMVSPRQPDGPPIRRGKPYSAIAHLAESVHAFVAIANGLRSLSISAPAILGRDLDAGVLLVEDLGAQGVVNENGPVPSRYEEAVRLLARMHAVQLPHTLPVSDGVDHVIPPYDMEALQIEVDLLLDWYVPATVRTLPALARSQFTGAWVDVLRPVIAGPQTWTLRDYHSPNLLWLPERQGLQRIGVIDFQDAVLGHPAYDVMSLLQDARVTVPPALELQLLRAYASARASDADFDMADFAAAYAVLGAQRATKLLGIFMRLDRRDGKPQYLAHLPRIKRYLLRNLAHPALAPVKKWYETYLIHVVEGD